MRQGTGGAARRLRAVAAALLILGALAAQAAVQRSFESAWPRREIEQLLYLPSGRHLKALTLGFSNLAADVLWIKVIGYFGGHALTDREYPWLYHLLDQTTTLDPYFGYPYLFGGIVLSVERESSQESIALLAKGMSRFPGEWRYPFYIGFSAFYNLNDPVRAAVFMRYASSLPGSPEYLPHLAASLLAESGQVDAAVRFLETVAEGTREGWVRDKINHKIRQLRAGNVPEALRGFLSGKKAP